jgi:multiple sugar transport system ATP-binding protein
MARVTYLDASCHYPGNPAPAVDDLSLDIADGEWCSSVRPAQESPPPCGWSPDLRT